jgi:hypothetical protein
MKTLGLAAALVLGLIAALVVGCGDGDNYFSTTEIYITVSGVRCFNITIPSEGVVKARDVQLVGDGQVVYGGRTYNVDVHCDATRIETTAAPH